MDKKEVYEHLAKIYLDASSKGAKKEKEYSRVFKNLFSISVVLILILAAFLITNLNRNRSLNTEIALILIPDAIKINFHFDPAKKESYSVSLNRLDLSRFRTLGFFAKKADYKDRISLRVEFISSFKEKSEIYFKDIPSRWQEYQINLSEFKNISDWSNMSSLSFIIEEWNVRDKRGVVYIDNLRLLK